MSDDRVIHCSDYEVGLAAPLSRWLTANGVEPHNVPLDSTVTVTGEVLTYVAFIRDDSGAPQLVPNQPAFQRGLVAVPLISPPEAHGL